MPATHSEEDGSDERWIQVIPTAIVAAIAAGIAYQQFKTARHQLRLNLYEKRYKVYAGLRGFLLVTVAEAKPDIDDLIEVNVETAEADFLFGPEIPKFIAEVKAKASGLMALKDSLREDGLPVGPERTDAARRSYEIAAWVDRQIETAAKLFAPYLDFQEVRT